MGCYSREGAYMQSENFTWGLIILKNTRITTRLPDYFGDYFHGVRDFFKWFTPRIIG